MLYSAPFYIADIIVIAVLYLTFVDLLITDVRDFSYFQNSLNSDKLLGSYKPLLLHFKHIILSYVPDCSAQLSTYHLHLYSAQLSTYHLQRLHIYNSTIRDCLPHQSLAHSTTGQRALVHTLCLTKCRPLTRPGCGAPWRELGICLRHEIRLSYGQATQLSSSSVSGGVLNPGQGSSRRFMVSTAC